MPSCFSSSRILLSSSKIDWLFIRELISAPNFSIFSFRAIYLFFPSSIAFYSCLSFAFIVSVSFRIWWSVYLWIYSISILFPSKSLRNLLWSSSTAALLAFSIASLSRRISLSSMTNLYISPSSPFLRAEISFLWVSFMRMVSSSMSSTFPLSLLFYIWRFAISSW